jgi:hypothetical protein
MALRIYILVVEYLKQRKYCFSKVRDKMVHAPSTEKRINFFCLSTAQAAYSINR